MDTRERRSTERSRGITHKCYTLGLAYVIQSPDTSALHVAKMH